MSARTTRDRTGIEVVIHKVAGEWAISCSLLAQLPFLPRCAWL